ncbi:hypothetical protein MPRF_26340 [Mycolicibacterium parafortuitum]|uniref:Uncharacterized protein n=1 Tax=Mycolicibacterium parafortuitum TaxID=39692 RepID=A0A7I7U3V1_MYCPF|nr:hypothetical protein [Mycolicibacterium parafortuitum]BBY75735.1 hypothetical protein MPRF_26340 [Mycolicibacterium parafortuitum]
MKRRPARRNPVTGRRSADPVTQKRLRQALADRRDAATQSVQEFRSRRLAAAMVQTRRPETDPSAVEAAALAEAHAQQHGLGELPGAPGDSGSAQHSGQGG